MTIYVYYKRMYNNNEIQLIVVFDLINKHEINIKMKLIRTK